MNDQATDAYDAIAPVYDAFTAHHNREAWLGELLPLLIRHGLSGDRLLDVGCGTGESFLPMLARGWRVTGCDASAAMLDRAREKVGEAAQLELADMRALPRFGSFDLVWALDDTINYLLTSQDLVATLAGMRDNLTPSGLMLFDANGLAAYRTFFAERQVVNADEVRLVWNGQTSPEVEPGSICEAIFEVEGDSEVRAHRHRQRHFPEADVLAALSEIGLECLDVAGHGFDGILKRPLDESVHTKAIYVAHQTDSARSR